MRNVKSASEKYIFENEHALVNAECRGNVLQVPFCVEPTFATLPKDEGAVVWLWDLANAAAQDDTIPTRPRAAHPPDRGAYWHKNSRCYYRKTGMGKWEKPPLNAVVALGAPEAQRVDELDSSSEAEHSPLE